MLFPPGKPVYAGLIAAVWPILFTANLSQAGGNAPDRTSVQRVSGDSVGALRGRLATAHFTGPTEETAARLVALGVALEELAVPAGSRRPDPSEAFSRGSDRPALPVPAGLRDGFLELQRLDGAGRKERLDEIVASADTILGHEPPLVDALKAEVLYRKARALGYMELPDVLARRPIENPAAHHAEFEATFARLDALVDTTGEAYFLLRVRRDRRRGDLGRALRLLQERTDDGDRLLYDKKRRDLYRDLGWHGPADQQHERMLVRWGDAVPPEPNRD